MANSLPYIPAPCDIKHLWPDGPWNSEPDIVSWRAHGLQCALIRHPSLGFWCGYVQVPKGHPLHGLSYNARAKYPKSWQNRSVNIDRDIGIVGLVCASINTNEDISEATLDLIFFAHGGLSYGRDSWLGFDCGHLGDLSPGLPCQLGDVYRDVNYTRIQTMRLAEQIAAYPEALRA